MTLIQEALNLVSEAATSTLEVIHCNSPEMLFKSFRGYGGWYHPQTKLYLPAGGNKTHRAISLEYLSALARGETVTGLPEEKEIDTKLANTAYYIQELYRTGWVRIVIYNNQIGLEGVLNNIASFYKFAGYLIPIFRFTVINIDERSSSGAPLLAMHPPFYLSDSRSEKRLARLLK